MERFLFKVLSFWYGSIVYRKHGYNEVCCCGDDMWLHSISDGGTYYACRSMECPSRCMKEYAVTTAANKKLKAIGFSGKINPWRKG